MLETTLPSRFSDFALFALQGKSGNREGKSLLPGRTTSNVSPTVDFGGPLPRVALRFPLGSRKP